MLDIGQTVLYGANGVCRIEDITVKSVGKQKMEYYVLKPVDSESSTLFVPTANEALVKKIRSVLSESEIRGILADRQACEDWNDNKIVRSEHFKDIIARGDSSELVRMIRLLHLHAQQQLARGKRLHISDERFLKEAEKMVCGEFALVLNVSRDDVIELILHSKAA